MGKGMMMVMVSGVCCVVFIQMLWHDWLHREKCGKKRRKRGEARNV